MSDYPAEWVEKAAEAAYRWHNGRGPATDPDWIPSLKGEWEAIARAVLDAVAPTIRADAAAQALESAMAELPDDQADWWYRDWLMERAAQYREKGKA